MSATADLDKVIAVLAALLLDPGPAECWGCGSHEIRCKGLCGPCYFRWDNAGRPAAVPPRRRRPRRTGNCRADYEAARSLGASVSQAAKYAGVPVATGRRYEAEFTPATPHQPRRAS